MAAHSSTRGHKLFQCFLAVVGLSLMALDSVSLDIVSNFTGGSGQGSGLPFDVYARYLIPEIACFLMFTLLAFGRPRFSNPTAHFACRFFFSSLVAGSLLYPSAHNLSMYMELPDMPLDMLPEGTGEPITGSSMYLCTAAMPGDMNQCRVNLARDMITFLSVPLILLELFLARRAGEFVKGDREIVRADDNSNDYTSDEKLKREKV
ncbi:hypothetical protein BGZ94_007638 [Podila epigama]|nr:hypothetical protein BGZ94_007638 [Podila epigama]